jgi:hypothetical protein
LLDFFLDTGTVPRASASGCDCFNDEHDDKVAGFDTETPQTVRRRMENDVPFGFPLRLAVAAAANQSQPFR